MGMARNSSLRRFLHNVYGYAFFNKLILLTPVYAVFMQSHGLGGMLGSWRYSVMILGMILIGVGLWALLCVRGRCAVAPMPGAHAIKQTYPRPKA